MNEIVEEVLRFGFNFFCCFRRSDENVREELVRDLTHYCILYLIEEHTPLATVSLLEAGLSCA